MSNESFEADIAKSLGMSATSEGTKEPTQTEGQKTEPQNTAEQTTETQNSSLESTSTSEQSQNTLPNQSDTESQTESAPSDFGTLLHDKSGGKYSSYEDVEKALTDMQTPQYATEQMAKINEYVSKGGTLENYILTQSMDYTALDEKQIMFEKLAVDNPTMTESDVQFLIDNKYKTDSEKFTADEVRLAKIQLAQDSNSARASLIERQNQYATPTSTVDNEAQQKEVQTRKDEWAKLSSESASNFQSLEIDMNGQGEKFTFAATDDSREKLAEMNGDLSKFWNRYMNEDGSENINKLNRELFILDNFDTIVRSAVTQYQSRGSEDILKTIKNPSYNPDSKPTSDQGPKTMDQQIFDELQKDW